MASKNNIQAPHTDMSTFQIFRVAEAALHSGWTMSKDILEFFLKVLRRVSDMLGPPLFIGNSALGRKVGSGEELSDMCRTVEGWRSWNHEERERARAASEFLLPVLWDPTGRGSHDWVLAIAESSKSGEAIGCAADLCVTVFDRASRPQAANAISEKVAALLRGVRSHAGGALQVKVYRRSQRREALRSTRQGSLDTQSSPRG